LNGIEVQGSGFRVERFRGLSSSEFSAAAGLKSFQSSRERNFGLVSRINIFILAIKKYQITKHKYQTNHNDRNSKSQTIGD